MIPLNTTVTTSTLVNVRQGAPSTSAPVVRKLAAGTTVAVTGLTTGDMVQGNAQWYALADNAYLWSGGCTAPSGGPSTGSAPTGSGVSSGGAPPVLDLYHGDAVSSFASAKGAGVLGVIHKATTGGSGQDPAYAQRKGQALGQGLLWGAYHWGTAADVTAQVTNFLNTAQPDAYTLVALDFEPDAGNQMTLEMAREFLQQVDAKLGRKAVIYSGSTLKDALGGTVDPFFGSHRLWLAQYGQTAHVQASWQTYWLWQYSDGSDPGLTPIPGIPGNSQGYVDRNRTQLSPADLTAQWAG